METVDRTLKPCPFCGENFMVVSRERSGCEFQYQVVCDKTAYKKIGIGEYVYGCGASSGFYNTIADAIDAWNRRDGNAR